MVDARRRSILTENEELEEKLYQKYWDEWTNATEQKQQELQEPNPMAIALPLLLRFAIKAAIEIVDLKNNQDV
jgi:hypothetical protein